ncbi:MAG: sigma-54-dependent Fis family transcriptional regulator [Pseudomonadales bacterium]|nr:sigma-54-dependent Fis family transcriptional regulator [Pseudomonadales bacterium]
MAKVKMLVVDDDAAVCRFCETALARIPNLTVTSESRPKTAIKLCESNKFDIVLSDLNMGKISGVDILKRVKEQNPHTPVIIMTGYPSLDNSVECLRLGAADYVLKPLLLEDLLTTVTRVIDETRLQQENSLLRRQLERKSSLADIIGKSDVMNTIKNTISNLADTNVDVLIWGETGTGKELVARNIHTSSDRANKPFVPVDCSAIPPELFESEFFGHERGAFTGATERSLGLMEYADGGTLFLDEIAELSLAQQAKLLRALQERKFRRVGSRQEVEVDIRLLAATNRDLKEEVKAKRFREDLYFRIYVGEIRLPPLRQRLGDVAILLHHYLEVFGREMKRPDRVTSDEVKRLLDSYTWPGNVRELINVVRRMLAMSKRKILNVDDVPEDIRSQVQASGDKTYSAGFLGEKARMMEQFEYDYMVSILKTCGGDISAVARMADISRQSVYRMLDRLELDAKNFRLVTNK